VLRKVGWPITLIVLAVGGYYGWNMFGFARYHNADPKFSFRIIGGWKSEKTQVAGWTTIIFTEVVDEQKQEVLRVGYTRNTTGARSGVLKQMATNLVIAKFQMQPSPDNNLVERTDFAGRPGYIARGTGSDRRKRPAAVFGAKEGYIFCVESPREDYALRAADTFKVGK